MRLLSPHHLPTSSAHLICPPPAAPKTRSLPLALTQEELRQQRSESRNEIGKVVGKLVEVEQQRDELQVSPARHCPRRRRPRRRRRAPPRPFAPPAERHDLRRSPQVERDAAVERAEAVEAELAKRGRVRRAIGRIPSALVGGIKGVGSTFKNLGATAGFQAAMGDVDRSDRGLEKAFSSVDADSSGKISIAEMKAAAPRPPRPPAPARPMHALGLARRRRVSWRLPARSARAASPVAAEHVPVLTAPPRSPLRPRHDRHPTSPPPPAQAHIKKTYGEGLDEKMVKEMVQEADTNQDGEVDLEEFKAIMRAGL